MSASHPISRRSAISGLGAGSLGLFLASHDIVAQTRDNRESGSAPGGFDTSALSLLEHPLTGRWLSMMGLLSNPNITVAVPSFFGADGTVVLFFPGTEAAQHGVQIKGPAMGTWEAVDERSGHFTAVQVLSAMNGAYVGTVTLDGFAVIGEDGETYTLDGPEALFTVRDHLNAITERLGPPAANPMRGFRMRAGNPGFQAAAANEHLPFAPAVDPRTPE
jgi:hypothetical protein